MTLRLAGHSAVYAQIPPARGRLPRWRSFPRHSLTPHMRRATVAGCSPGFARQSRYSQERRELAPAEVEAFLDRDGRNAFRRLVGDKGGARVEEPCLRVD